MTRPASAPSRVDLPAPLRPISATTSPGRTLKSTPVSARTGPGWRTTNRFVSANPRAPSRPPAAVSRGTARSLSSRRRPAARRRASRTLIGSGSQCSSRPSRTTGGATAAVLITSAGGPSAIRVPPASSTTRSAYCTTRSSRCSAISTVIPRSCTSRWIAASTSSAACGSSAEVGSSRTSTCGCAVSAAPIATRCRCPPDSVVSARCRRSARPSRSRVSSTRIRITAGATPRDSIEYASSSSTVSVTKEASGSWATMPTTSARSRGRQSRVLRPATVTSPVSRPPEKCGTRPLTARSRVDLPDPVRPISSTSSPSSTARSTSCRVGSAYSPELLAG